MNLDWDRMFRRYVYDAETTPYGTPVDRLTRSQADSEVFVYTVFLIILFATVGVAGLSGKMPHGDVIGVPIYAFFLVWMAVLFAWTKSVSSGAFCATAPVAGMLYCAVYGFPPALGIFDKALIIAVLALLLVYSWRIVRIAAGYTSMPPGKPRKRGRRNPYEPHDTA
ncbi:MAG: hypothetical protein AAF732_02135 [Pseudomonadota bacterium]